MIVYKHTNRLNGKAYIGITNKTCDGRWREHCQWSERGSQFKFHNAIRKHGEDVWIHEILAHNLTVDQAKELEVRFIAEHGTVANGYNMTTGGDGVRGIEWTMARRERLRQRLLGKPKPEEVRRKISSSLTGDKHYWFGRAHSEETREKMRTAQLGEKHPQFGKVGSASPNARKFAITYPDGSIEIIVGLAEFARRHNLSPSGLAAVSSGRRPHHKGFRVSAPKD